MTLPIELLVEVADSAVQDQATLLALVLTCKKVGRYAEKRLYEHPRVRGYISTTGLFLQLHRRSDFADLVQNLTIGVADHFPSLPPNFEDFAIARETLAPCQDPMQKRPLARVFYASHALPELRHCIALTVDLSYAGPRKSMPWRSLSTARVAQWVRQCQRLKTLCILGRRQLDASSPPDFVFPATLNHVYLTIPQPLPALVHRLPYLTIRWGSHISYRNQAASWQPCSMTLHQFPHYSGFTPEEPYLHLKELIMDEFRIAPFLQVGSVPSHILDGIRSLDRTHFPELRRITINLCTDSHGRRAGTNLLYDDILDCTRRACKDIGISLEVVYVW